MLAFSSKKKKSKLSKKSSLKNSYATGKKTLHKILNDKNNDHQIIALQIIMIIFFDFFFFVYN